MVSFVLRWHHSPTFHNIHKRTHIDLLNRASRQPQQPSLSIVRCTRRVRCVQPARVCRCVCAYVCARIVTPSMNTHKTDNTYDETHTSTRVCVSRYTQWTGGSWNLHSHIVRICFSISPSAVRIGIVSNQNQNKKKNRRACILDFFFNDVNNNNKLTNEAKKSNQIKTTKVTALQSNANHSFLVFNNESIELKCRGYTIKVV